MLLVRSFAKSCLSLIHPKILWIGLAPFFMVSLFWGMMLWLIWEPGLEWMRYLFEHAWLTQWLASALIATGWDEMRAALAPLLLVAACIPLIAISLLVAIGLMTVPSVVKHVSRRVPFSQMHQSHGGSFWGSCGWALSSSLWALLVLIVTVPLWILPPLVAFIPPLIWGWLTMRLMSYDALALHASEEERLALLLEHRWMLWFMGIVCGLLGAMPTFAWITSAISLIFFPFVSIFALWIYSFVFVFSALWFSHYLLEALRVYRQTHPVVVETS